MINKLIDRFALVSRKVIFVIIVTVVVGMILAFPTKWLWNWLAPILSNQILPKITVWQAWGLNILCGILFGGTRVSSSK